MPCLLSWELLPDRGAFIELRELIMLAEQISEVEAEVRHSRRAPKGAPIEPHDS